MSSGAAGALLDDILVSLEQHDWEGAYATLAAPPADAGAEWFDALAEAAWWTGRLDECIAARDQAFSGFQQAGDDRQAGRCAALLYEHCCFRAQPSIGNGWLRRARRLLDADRDCPEYGVLLIRESQQVHGSGDLDRAFERASEALDLGRRLGDASLEGDALQALGRILIDRGDPIEGLAHLDEAMLLAVEGRLDPYTTGKAYCSMVSACDELGDLRRAAEWTDAVGTWSDHHPVSLFPGLCRVHRAGLLQWRGAWVEAEAEVRKGVEELQGIHVPNAALGFLKLGELRRRMGDHPGAEEAFQKAEELHGQAWAGLALLRLAQHKHAEATSIIQRALEETSWNRLARGKLLPALVEVTVASGDLDAAEVGLEELSRTALDYDSPVLLAAADLARGRLELARGNHGGACAALNGALRRWTDLDAPYEVATTRQLMGQACHLAGDADGATHAFDAAETIFLRLGAEADARLTRALGGETELPDRLTEREVEVLRAVAAGLTNRQIGEELVISQKTVARHLSNIFTKIDVASRAAATAYAFEHHLVG